MLGRQVLAGCIYLTSYPVSCLRVLHLGWWSLLKYSGRRLPERCPDVVQEAQDLLIRAVDRCLVIRNGKLGAVVAHDLVSASDVAAGHGRKKMVLDLIVERSI